MLNKPIYFVSGNQKKVKEMAELLPGIKHLAVDLPEIQEVDSKKIIAAKLQVAFNYCNGPVMVDDTSLYLDCFARGDEPSQLPGPLIKWFLLSLQNSGLSSIAQKLGNVRARAQTIIGFAFDPETIYFFDGSINGTIVSPHGDHGFGWDYIFQPDGSLDTFSTMSIEEKNKISPRSQAVQKLKNFLATVHQHEHCQNGGCSITSNSNNALL